ncbi:tetratricopeptide repeat protein [Desulfococcaceae bacterium HSG7]|nr:tetratricopeptide repeat protein [Desulfococcaceae bacterium HSG7]
MTKKNSAAKAFFFIRFEFLICLFLIITLLGVYWQVRTFGFTLFDDTLYVSENRYVKNGLNFKAFKWAFNFENKTNTHWHPLTWLSHALDCHIYGLEPGRHHITNLIFHIVSTLLLFLSLNRMTDDLWQSAFVASLFALHPLNVNSVAWIAERKNVLSTFFWMLTVWLYAWYCAKPKLYRYLTVVLSLTLGLLSKPMLVTLPCVLILLDYWPLERFQKKWSRNGCIKTTIKKLNPPMVSIRHKLASFPFVLILEKTPLFILSGITVYLSSSALQDLEPMTGFSSVPMMLRIENALVSYIIYINKMFWPDNLAVFYPYPDMIPLWQTIGAFIILLVITLFAIRKCEQHSYILIGWLWYIGTLVPALGLVQTGLWPAYADRFTYIPLIGLFIILAYGLPELYFKWHYRKTGLIAAVTIILITLIFITYNHVRYWKDDIALFQQTIAVTEDNYIAHNNLGLAFMDHNQPVKAIKHFSEALRIYPGHTLAHNNMGFLLAKQGKIDKAIRYYLNAIRINPDFKKAHANIAVALMKQNRAVEAIEHYQTAVRIDPKYAEVHLNLGIALAGQGMTKEAVNHLHTVLEINDGYEAQAHYNLGNILRMQNIDEAIYHYLEALQIKPDFVKAHNNLGITFMKKGKTDDAVIHFQKALQISPNNKAVRNNLGRVRF